MSASASLRYLDLAHHAGQVAVDDVAALAGTYWVSADPEGAGYTRFRTVDGEITAHGEHLHALTPGAPTG